jgi:hypothetical protein
LVILWSLTFIPLLVTRDTTIAFATSAMFPVAKVKAKAKAKAKAKVERLQYS